MIMQEGEIGMPSTEKKRLVFISQWGSNTKGVNGGNVKKVLSQIETFEKCGFEVKKVIKEIPKYKEQPSLADRVISKSKNILPFCTNQAIIRYEEVGEADYYYIRFRGYDYHFRKLLKDIRKNNPKAKVVLEYSDYPYIEYKGRDKVGDFLVRKRDEFERNKCAQYIDRVATLLSTDKLDGVPCLKILNGLDISKIPVRVPRTPDNSVHVLIVASLQRVHGVDRFVRGMKEYYKEPHDEQVYLHVVGGGEVIQSLKEEAAELGDKVIFHGFMYDKDLDAMYDTCDIGIEFLAPHRKEIKISASLKSREYISRGFPFVSACELDINALGFTDYLLIEDGEGPIDIDSIISYYREFSANLDKKLVEMRTFAETYLGMDFAMKEVTDYYLEGEK